MVEALYLFLFSFVCVLVLYIRSQLLEPALVAGVPVLREDEGPEGVRGRPAT